MGGAAADGSRQVDLFVLQVLRRVGEADRPC